jgi:hypothetical protein
MHTLIRMYHIITIVTWVAIRIRTIPNVNACMDKILQQCAHEKQAVHAWNHVILHIIVRSPIPFALRMTDVIISLYATLSICSVWTRVHLRQQFL